MYANKIVDGKAEGDEAQALIARMFGQIIALSSPSNGDEEVRVH
jgi:hypothetical protein